MAANSYVEESAGGAYRPPAQRRRPGPQTGYESWLGNEQAQQPPQASYQPPAPTPYQPPAPTPSYQTNGYAQPGYTAQPNVGAPAGWDPTKWQDNSYQSPKYAIGRILADAGAPSLQTLQGALPQLQQAYPGATLQGDRLTLPGGGPIDVLQDSEGANPQWWWGPTDVAAPGVAGAAGGGAATGLGESGVAGASPLSGAYNAALLRMLNPQYTQVDPNDPTIKGQTDVYRAEAERARAARRNAEMEALGAKGLGSSGAADAALASGYQDMSRGVSGYAANAVAQEQTARRNEMMDALRIATAMGMQDEARALQWQIAQLDAQLSREGRAQQGQQFNDQLGWQMYQYGNISPLQYYQMLLNG